MNFNVKNTDQIDMMKRLINYGKIEESQTNTGMLTPRLEYSATAADGKTYGIIKECNKFYIKVAPPKDTELLAEDFQFIGGFMNKKDYEYPSYSLASKQFDLKMMSINEAHTVKKEVTQYKQEEPAEWQINETKEMRSELNRFNQIMQNVGIILNEDSNAVVNTNKVPEAPASHPSTKKVNSPFTDTAVAKGDKDFDKTQTDPKKAGAPFNNSVNVTDKDMQSDKKPTENTDAVYTEKAKYVPDNSVADKNPSGGKAVKVNEGEKIWKMTLEQLNEVKEVLAWNKNKDYMDTSNGTEIGSSAPFTDELGKESNQEEANTEAIHEDTVAHLAQDQNTPTPETGNIGDTAPFDEKVNEGSYFDMDNEDDNDRLLRSILKGDKGRKKAKSSATNQINKEKSDAAKDDQRAADSERKEMEINIDESYDDDDPTSAWDRELAAILRGDKNRRKAKQSAKSQIGQETASAARDDAKVDAMETDVRSNIELDDCNHHCNEEFVNPNEVDGMEMNDEVPFPEVEDNYGDEEYFADTHSNWGISSGGNNVWEPDPDNYPWFDADNEEFDLRVNDIVDSVIREAKLDVFGKHPAYQKTPMTTPPNTEVAPNGAKDWNDKSVASDTPFGTKIGSSAPFDEKVMNDIVDAVIQRMGFQKKA